MAHKSVKFNIMIKQGNTWYAPKIEMKSTRPQIQEEVLSTNLALSSQKLNNINIVYFVAWPKEKYTGTAATSQLLQPSKDQKCQQLGEGQAEEKSS